MKESHKCRFCEYEWDMDHPCYNGDDPCGYQECPACYSCQGPWNIATPRWIEGAKMAREMREKKKELQ